MRVSLIAMAALVLAGPATAQLASPNAAGVTFAHVHLNVVDIELHKRLWVDHFDGVVVEKGPLTTIKFPNFFLILTEREATGPSQGTVTDHFGFKVRDLDAIHEAWRAAGYEVQGEFTGAEGFRNSYLLAPDGVRFELQEDASQSEKAVGYHVHFWTTEFRELWEWYADVFSAVPRQRGRIETTADVPGMNLSFATCRAECGPTRGRAIDHIGFEVDDLDAFAQMLEARGIELEFAPRYIESIALKIAFFTDPSGVRVELTEGLDEY
jgi:catechol 2,3-dioxygenase-like lactoylglutathione lyase family enzyme